MSNKVYGANPTQPGHNSKYHYVYRITNLITGMHYYGKRSSIHHPLSDLGTKYRSSSLNKEFRQDQIANPKNYKYKVVRVCSTPKEAILWESLIHLRLNVAKHPMFINRVNQKSIGFGTDGFTTAICSATNQNLGLVSLDDPRWATNEIVHTNTGWLNAVDASGTIIRVRASDPRWKSNELQHPSKDQKTMREVSTGKTLRVSTHDARIASGELIFVHTPHLRITNGITERPYQLDGSDTIPNGWWICFVNFIPFDIIESSTGNLVASCVNPNDYAEANNISAQCLLRAKGEFYINKKSWIFDYKGLYLKPTHLSESLLNTIDKQKKAVLDLLGG
jgi:hypothetical protein